MRPQRAVAFTLFTIALLLGGCAGGERLAPVSRVDPVATGKPDEHTVRKGDTLYAIAWEYDLDFRDLAAWNGVEHPFVIYPGQVLALRGSPRKADGAVANAEVSIAALPEPSTISGRVVESADRVAAADSPATTTSGDTAAAESVSDAGSGTDLSKANVPAPDVFDGAVPVGMWHWPTKGKVIGSFGRAGEKGIQISGGYEQPVVAAADGRVVYSGTGLVGYGRLIVLKHNKSFFSAYAHNSRILVKEGEVVQGGQRIALMGSSGSDKVKLHFEIRRDGKPVDPLRYLPRRTG